MFKDILERFTVIVAGLMDARQVTSCAAKAFSLPFTEFIALVNTDEPGISSLGEPPTSNASPRNAKLHALFRQLAWGQAK